MNMRPYDLPDRKGAPLIGDSVPKPLGFSAFPPEWLFSLGRLAPPRHSGRWVGARVASLRSPILRPGKASINHFELHCEKRLPKNCCRNRRP
jgi:hypothetical protein